MTLPLFASPLFGSFLPLCELLRLRTNEDEVISLLSFWFSLRRTRIPGSHSRLQTANEQRLASETARPRSRAYLDANDDDGMPVIVLDADIDAILCLRSGNVSITKSRNSNRAPTSFCNSCSEMKKQNANEHRSTEAAIMNFTFG